MPKQHTLFGRPIPPTTPRRVAQLLGCIAIFAIVTLLFTLPTSVPGPSLSKLTTDSHGFSLPKLTVPFHPFQPSVHAPPIQENSTSGDASWHSYWNWLSPFSSSVTFDETRSLLPPLAPRPAIYTYYDHIMKMDSDRKAAESEILLTWRKAWWAHGFKPIILGPHDATKNPLHEEMQKLGLEPGKEAELSRWLAWERMGQGILCDYYALPMGPYGDPLLSLLRRGEYHQLTRYEGLGSGLFSGSKAAITAALKTALASKELAKKDLVEAMPLGTFAIDSALEAIAFYDPETLTAKYRSVSEALIESFPNGLKLLNQLMTAHLHETWRDVFSDGIAVLKPLPEHMSVVVEPALKLAHLLSQCPESPIPASCPPNRPKCKPCETSMPLEISTPPLYQNKSTKYIIGTLPHPYTLLSLSADGENIDFAYVRRRTARDQYLVAATKQTPGTGYSAARRLIVFKEAVASEYGSSHSIWFIAEEPIPDDLDWYFGFPIPGHLDSGKSETPVLGSDRRPLVRPLDEAASYEKYSEKQLLEDAKRMLKSKEEGQVRLKGAVEAWNMGDVEAWKFVRAFLSRSRVERQKWENDEKRFAGGAGVEDKKRQGSGRWLD